MSELCSIHGSFVEPRDPLKRTAIKGAAAILFLSMVLEFASFEKEYHHVGGSAKNKSHTNLLSPGFQNQG